MNHIKYAKKKQKLLQRKKIIRRRLIIAASLCLCMELLVLSHLIFQRHNSAEKEASATIEDTDLKDIKIQQEELKEPEKVSITISSTGDCTLGTDENFNYATSLNAYYEAQGADYFLQNVRDIFEKDDLTIVNMEGTFTNETSRADKTFAFKASPDFVSILTGSSVEAANIANNHSHDYGEKSYTDTIQTLEDAGIESFGYERVKVLDVKGIKVGVTGIYELATHEGCADDVKKNIQALKDAGAQVIIANFHWGIEREYLPNDTQKMLAHLAIDEGADLVIGHHPHVLQGVEKYNGKYIAYSLGNFCFGGNSNPSDKDTMIVQQTFDFEDGVLTSSSDLNLIPCSLSTASGYNDYCPTPLEGDEKQRVLDKIDKYSENL